MNKNIFIEEMAGLSIDRVVRDYEYSMNFRHFHDTYELYFLLEGERFYFIDKETFLVRAGMAVLVGPNQIHKTSMAEDSYHDRIILQVKGEAFNEYLTKNGIVTLEELFNSHYGIIELTAEDWQRCCHILFDVKDELSRKNKDYEVMVRLRLSQLFLILYRYGGEGLYEGRVANRKSKKHQLVDQVAEYLSNHSEQSDSLDDIAARFFISRAYLTRIFREVTGYTVNEYRNVARIRKAQKLLKNSGYSVTEIAAITGFESVTYFDRVFKKHADMPPLRYRKDKGGGSWK